ncbi:hypothetical protein C0995_009323 [Termitomyces sp. Mi166|nr:hypothetical protein C0995_009323 [Termitomyces sp. Mi166\
MSPKAIPIRQLGRNGPTVSAIGLGAMGMGAFYGQSDDKESLDTLTYAADRGVIFWDTSDIYGHSEDLIGQWFTTTGRRSEIFLATKFGARELGSEDVKPISKPSYITKAVNRSLNKLKTNYIDLYYQHRVDRDVPIEVVLETLKPFVEKGQIRWIGLSECNIDTLKRARAVPGIGEKVIAAQMEFSPFELYLEKTGFVDAIDEAGMAVVAYSPLGRGLVTGRHVISPADFPDDDFRKHLPRFSKENFPKNLKIIDELQKIADKYNATTSQITIAWILAEHPNCNFLKYVNSLLVIPIPGVRSVQRLEENAHAAEIMLEQEDAKAIRAVVESAEVEGERYPSFIMPTGDCIPLSEWKGEH